jgi:Family of unknown function (DUF6352)
MKDFWLSCGHHLIDRDERGQLRPTDEFIKLYLARPELTPPPEACSQENKLHSTLQRDPWRPVAAAEIDAIADADARENWRFMIALRDHIACHGTLEATYMALVRQRIQLPPILLDQLVHLILRNTLDQCDDAYIVRAAELFFRPQRITIYDGALLAADAEQITVNGLRVSPLATMFGLQTTPDIEVLCDDNASSYWDRSDRFDLALDLTAGRRGLAALAAVIAYWVKHLLGIDIVVEPLKELKDIVLQWYVGLDADGTKIGDALWQGSVIDEATRAQVVGLFRLTIRDSAIMSDGIAGEPVYLILAMNSDNVLRMKPQNLLTGLPTRHLENVT